MIKNLQKKIHQKKQHSKLSSGAVAYIGLGANLAGAAGMPHITLRCVLQTIHIASGAKIRLCSHFYKTAAIGQNAGGDFINAVAACHLSCRPEIFLRRLKRLERIHGRKSGCASNTNTRTNARPLDLDVLDYAGRIEQGTCIVPHPRMNARRFVMAPLAEIAPFWQHPISGLPVRRLMILSSGRIAVFSLQRRRRSRKNKRIV